MLVGEAFVAIRPSTTGFEQEAQTGIAGPLKKLAVGAAAAFAAVKVKDFLGGAIGEAREANRVAAQTTQVIKTTGGAAGLTAKDFDTLAGSISKKVGIDDEAIQSAENLLATFTRVRNETGEHNKVFDRATKAIVDMSAVQGELQGNTLLVGKALQDPVKGMAALQRVGVRLSDTQKKQIKDFAAVGDTASAQKVILKELETQFGGQAAAQATAAQKAKVAWGNFQEQIGSKLIPVIDKALKALMSIGNFISDNKSLFVALGIGIGTVLVPAFVAWAAAAAAAAAATLLAAAPAIALGAAIAAAAYIIIKNWDSIKALFVAVFNWVKDNWPLLLAILTGPIGLAVKFIIDHWDGIVSFMSELPGRIGRAVKGMWDGIKDAFKSAINWIIRAWNNLEFTLPGKKIFGVKIGGQTIGTPDIPTLHNGGTFRAPSGQTEGLALLRDGERVLPPGQGGGEIHIHAAEFTLDQAHELGNRYYGARLSVSGAR